MKKAEKIFNSAYAECRVYAKKNGTKRREDGSASGFNSIINEGTISVRTLNEVQKLINSEKKNIAVCAELGMLDADMLKVKDYAIDMVQATLDNTRKVLVR